MARSQLLAAVVMLFFGIASATAPTAFAANEYVIDPALSLNGSCATTKADSVPDPGCPGGSHPPGGDFEGPKSIVTDSYGNIYVASYGSDAANGKDGRIDIFNSSGVFISELPEPAGPKDLVVDSQGNLYVYSFSSGAHGLVVRYGPTGTYEPEAGKIEYADPPALVVDLQGGFLNSLAVTPSNDHLFVKRAVRIVEYGSAEEGNPILDESAGFGVLEGIQGFGLAVDEERGLIYAGDEKTVKVFELAPPHDLLRTIKVADIPGGDPTQVTSVAVDEDSGDFFILDGSSSREVYRFDQSGVYKGTVKEKLAAIYGSEVYVDNGLFSPNRRYLFFPSEESGVGIAFAYEPPGIVCTPEVESISFAHASEADSELRATINPCGGETHYVFEYTSEKAFEAKGFEGAAIAGEGDIPPGTVGIPVFAPADGLSPATGYRFRVVASNEEGSDEAESSFTTYLPPETITPCPNDAVRTGLSALLPDCRAYELVTPPNTNARTPRGIGKPTGIFFASRQASPGGDKVSFITDGGLLPGSEGTGSLSGDAYLATRGADGWSSASAGPTGVESPSPLTGSTSPDQGYSFWQSSGEGTASVEGKQTSYVRYPDGHSELVGQGDLGTDPVAEGKLISENGGHIIFSSAVHLEENAPPEGTEALYDRTADGVTHVVSLLPGDTPQAPGQNVLYQGTSLDGKGVAFTIGSVLYLRFDNDETYEVGSGVTFAGVAEGGNRIFYVEGGDLLAFDALTESVIEFSGSGDVTPVNVSPDGTAAYFVSPSVLAGTNPEGDEPEAGKENLYLSREGVLSFVGIVTERDVEGEFGETEQTEGLGLWTEAVEPSGTSGRYAIDPSRATPDGSVLLFESRANLTGYDPEGHAQIYRYDSVGNELDCLSCIPTGAPATGEASLQSIQQVLGGPEPFVSFALLNNLRPDGRRAFFQSEEALVVDDNDGLQDVYEWEDQGVGTCVRPGGCIYLISSGHSDRVDYLFAISDSGDDVFFRTADRLLPADTESTPSIYDARVGGGFPEAVVGCPLSQECPGPIGPGPAIGTPPSEATGPVDNFTPTRKKCPKGKRKVKRKGKVVCIKKHHKQRRAKSTRKGAGR